MMSVFKRVAFLEYVLLRVLMRVFLGKKKRDELIESKIIDIDRFMLRHFLNRKVGFVRPLSRDEVFVNESKFQLIAPWDDLGVIEETDTVYLKPKKGDVVVDAGAHYGFYTIRASKLVGEDGMVLAFEPHPKNYNRLVMNLKLNNVRNVKAFNLALGNIDGITRLYLDSHSGGHSMVFKRSNFSVNVKISKLDTIVDELELDKVDLIKIDTEGAELNILKGALKTIRKHHPKLTIAAYHTANEAEMIAKWLKKNMPSYNIKIINEKFLHAR